MVYITGDIHGDITRFKTKKMRQLKKGDTLIVCGDFGFIWNGSAREKRLLKWIGNRKYQVLFLEGTHDNLDLLSQYPTEPWQGGAVRRISGNLRHLVRGSIFSLEGSRFFVFGGGESRDKDIRQEGGSWWSEELPSAEELEKARQNLKCSENTVDYILTHQPGGRMHTFLTMKDHEPNDLEIFLDEVATTCNFKRWFFANYHQDQRLAQNQIVVFRDLWKLVGEKT